MNDTTSQEMDEDDYQRVYEPSKKTFDFRVMRATELPFNKRITLPPALEDRQKELNMQCLKEKLIKKSQTYVKEHGKDQFCNITKDEISGLKSLQKRIKDSEIVVFQTDKSGRFSVDTCDSYRRMTVPHVENDLVIDLQHHDDIETKMNAHSVMWVRMLNAGQDMSQEDRIKSNMTSKYNPIAPLYSLRKDHKVGFDQEKGPPGRPVCGAEGGLNEKLSYLLSLILDKVWLDGKQDTVCTSTEELLSGIDELNEELREGLGENRSIVVGSADVKALYPSLDVEFTVEIVSGMFENSGLEIEGIDYEEMGLYLAFTRSREELEDAGIGDVCHTRKNAVGRAPEMQGSGISNDQGKRFRSWSMPKDQPSKKQKRKMITESLKAGMKFVMKNHVYCFDGTIRKQSSGGPIGLKLTGTLAQVFMLWWDLQLKERLNALGIELPFYKRYVDDINICCFEVQSGTRYEGGQFVIHEGVDNRPADARVFDLIKCVGDSIHPSIQLEVDCPSQHTDGEVPILDVKVWVEKSRTVMYEFYSKEVSSKSVIDARSALPWSTKRTILTQEVLRILLNCSTDLDKQRIVHHVEHMVTRMQFSGYDSKFRGQIIHSAFKAYEKITEAVQRGERPLHRPKHWKREEREKDKEKKKKNWFRRGGYDTVIFIQATPESKLRKMLQKDIDDSDFNIRVVEMAGKSVKRHLQKSDPFQGGGCERDDCPVCASQGKGRCNRNGVLYTATCQSCESIYHGETGRNAYIRGKEHVQQLRGKKTESPLWEHCVERHSGEEQNFKFDVIKSFGGDAMLRQISEAVANNRTTAQYKINRKAEWNEPLIPRAIIT